MFQHRWYRKHGADSLNLHLLKSVNVMRYFMRWQAKGDGDLIYASRARVSSLRQTLCMKAFLLAASKVLLDVGHVNCVTFPITRNLLVVAGGGALNAPLFCGAVSAVWCDSPRLTFGTYHKLTVVHFGKVIWFI